ncbi:TadE/TadG family type IV pilus assembly protein [Affinibrenneria salicis]|nr:TadE/TadG family type IV pilus assembly protein [Affinibrenneria salicis]
MSALTLLLFNLRREQRGAVTLTWLLCFPLLLVALLGSIDFIRYSVVQSKLQNALDTAVISAGRNLEKFTPSDGAREEALWRADAISYFFSNMPPGFLGSSVSRDNLTITYSEETDGQGATSGQLVHMRATGTLPLLIAGMTNRTGFTLAAENEAVRRTRSDLEMVLALDNTGSMENENRIGALKAASRELVSTVLGASHSGGNSKSYIGIVPFADTVYIGADRARWLSPAARALPYIEAGKYWGGCVVEPYDGRFNARPGLPGSFEPLMTVGTLSSANGLQTAAALKTRDAPDAVDYRIVPGSTPEISGDRSISAGLDAHSGNIIPKFAFNANYRQWQYGDTGDVNNCPKSRQMLFLTSNENALNDRIDTMAVDGRTIIPLGLLWSWRMLDAGWRGERGWGDSEKPRNAAIGLNKAIVLLTDGNNGLDPIVDKTSTKRGVAIDGERDISLDYHISYQYQVRQSKNGDWSAAHSASHGFHLDKLNDDNHYLSFYKYANSADFHSLRIGSDEELDSSSTEIAPYGRLYQGLRNGNADWQVGNDTLNTLTAELCSNIKDSGIKLYTVVLGNGTNSSTKAMMQSCSSGTASYYFDATNVDDLSAAFASIAASLTELRLNK